MQYAEYKGSVETIYNADFTPMRLFQGKRKFESVEVMVTCTEAFSLSGSTKLSPTLKKSKSTRSNAILGCLDLKNSALRFLTENEGEWSFLLLVSDGVSSNRSAVKKILTW